MEELLLANEDLVTSLEDKERLGMFYAWVGWALRLYRQISTGSTLHIIQETDHLAL